VPEGVDSDGDEGAVQAEAMVDEEVMQEGTREAGSPATVVSGVNNTAGNVNGIAN